MNENFYEKITGSKVPRPEEIDEGKKENEKNVEHADQLRSLKETLDDFKNSDISCGEEELIKGIETTIKHEEKDGKDINFMQMLEFRMNGMMRKEEQKKEFRKELEGKSISELEEIIKETKEYWKKYWEMKDAADDMEYIKELLENKKDEK